MYIPTPTWPSMNLIKWYLVSLSCFFVLVFVTAELWPGSLGDWLSVHSTPCLSQRWKLESCETARQGPDSWCRSHPLSELQLLVPDRFLPHLNFLAPLCQCPISNSFSSKCHQRAQIILAGLALFSSSISVIITTNVVRLLLVSSVESFTISQWLLSIRISTDSAGILRSLSSTETDLDLWESLSKTLSF